MNSLTVYIPTFDEEEHIERCIDSFSLTKYDQLIVSDGKSCDSTVQIVLRICEKDRRVSLIEEGAKRPTWHGLREALEKLGTKYFYFVGADDIARPEIFGGFRNDSFEKFQYFLPKMQFYFERSEQYGEIHPSEEWLMKLNNANNLTEKVRIFIDYCGVDVMLLGVQHAKTFAQIMDLTYWDSRDGVNFWTMLGIILSLGDAGKIVTTPEVTLIKTFDHVRVGGTHSPNQTSRSAGLLEKLGWTINDVRTALRFKRHFSFNLIILAMLLFSKRGKKVADICSWHGPIPSLIGLNLILRCWNKRSGGPSSRAIGK